MTKKAIKPLIIFAITALFLGMCFYMLKLPVTQEASAADWVVTTTESRSNEVIVLQGNLIIESTGQLTLTNVTLKMDGQYYIKVYGKLFAYDSTFTSNKGARYGFHIRDGATSTLDGTNFFYCGYRGGEMSTRGLCIYADAVTVNNCFFNDSDAGVILDHSAYTNITGSTFKNLYHAIHILGGDHNNITSNVFDNNAHGIWIEQSSYNVARDNAISNATVGINLVLTNNNTIELNTLSYCTGSTSPYQIGAIYLRWASYNYIANNIFSNNYKDIHLENDNGTNTIV